MAAVAVAQLLNKPMYMQACHLQAWQLVLPVMVLGLLYIVIKWCVVVPSGVWSGVDA